MYENDVFRVVIYKVRSTRYVKDNVEELRRNTTLLTVAVVYFFPYTDKVILK